MTCGALGMGSTDADMAVGRTWASPETAGCTEGFGSREIESTRVGISRDDEREEGVWKIGG